MTQEAFLRTQIAIESLLGVKVSLRSSIAIVYTSDRDTFCALVESVARQTPAEASSACYFPGCGILVSPDATDPSSIAHELCHALIEVGRIATVRSDWAHEGFACIVGAEQLPRRARLGYLEVTCAWAQVATANPSILDLFVFSNDRKWYALAECFVRYLLRRAQDRPEVGATFFRILRTGCAQVKSTRRQLAHALGEPWEQVLDGLRDFLRSPERLDLPSNKFKV